MGYYVDKTSVEFLMGIQNVDQLVTWIQANPTISGIAFIGRSNVGKSSLINCIFGNKTAKVSNTPGRTREINIFKFTLKHNKNAKLDLKDLYIFDLPGYGFAEVSKTMSKNWNQLMNLFFMHINSNVFLINIQDARHPNQSSDQDFHKYLKYIHNSNEILLVFNKMDKLKTQKERSELNKSKAALSKTYKKIKYINFVSAETGNGVDEMLGVITTFLYKNSVDKNILFANDIIEDETDEYDI